MLSGPGRKGPAAALFARLALAVALGACSFAATACGASEEPPGDFAPVGRTRFLEIDDGQRMMRVAHGIEIMKSHRHAAGEFEGAVHRVCGPSQRASPAAAVASKPIASR